MHTVNTMEKNVWPAGHQKLANFFMHTIRLKSFITDVQKVRKQFGIPLEGYEGVDFNSWPQLPEQLSLSEKQKGELLKLMAWLAAEHRLGVMKNFHIPLVNFVIYNRIDLPEYYDLCAIQDHKRLDYSKQMFNETLYSDATHPISIRISPDATQRDVIDFIKGNFEKRIRPLQILHSGVPTATASKRKRLNTNIDIRDFIYDNKGLRLKELTARVNNTFGTRYIYNEISKLKSEEIKKRE